MSENIMEKRLRHRRRDLHQQRLRQGLADSFAAAFEEMGGTVTLVAAHEDGRADYSAEVGALAPPAAMCSWWRATSTRAAPASSRPRSTPAPSTPSCCPTAWSAMLSTISAPISTAPSASNPGTDSEGAAIYRHGRGCRLRRHLALLRESYDAAALILLAMQAAGSTDPADYAETSWTWPTHPAADPPGELGKALEMIANGEDVDYVGASAGTDRRRRIAGNYREIEIKDGKIETVVQFR
jgi:branched-chain amino acid transport system substrate-binding protein